MTEVARAGGVTLAAGKVKVVLKPAKVRSTNEALQVIAATQCKDSDTMTPKAKLAPKSVQKPEPQPPPRREI